MSEDMAQESRQFFRSLKSESPGLGRGCYVMGWMFRCKAIPCMNCIRVSEWNTYTSAFKKNVCVPMCVHVEARG